MKIVIAPDSFKESLSATAVAHAIREGLQSVLSDCRCECIPMADGGEGTIAALVAASNGETISVAVSGPRGDPVTAHYGLLSDGRTAVIECAQASGLALLDATRRNPLLTTSYGSGELIAAALAHPLRRLIIGLGGSATNDGGAGACQALGVRFSDRHGQVIETPLSGGSLEQIATIDVSALDPRLADIDVELATDVDNPLLGSSGATATFAPQKGADEAMITLLERGLEHFYSVVENSLGKRVIEVPGAGAAGGLGAAALAFLNARARPGFEIVEQAIGLRERLSGATLVITGEGRIDSQTGHGKAPAGVARVARELGIPVIALGGGLTDDAEIVLGDTFDAFAAAVCRPMHHTEALTGARDNLVRAGARIGRWLQLGRRLYAAHPAATATQPPC